MAGAESAYSTDLAPIHGLHKKSSLFLLDTLALCKQLFPACNNERLQATVGEAKQRGTRTCAQPRHRKQSGLLYPASFEGVVASSPAVCFPIAPGCSTCSTQKWMRLLVGNKLLAYVRGVLFVRECARVEILHVLLEHFLLLPLRPIEFSDVLHLSQPNLELLETQRTLSG